LLDRIERADPAERVLRRAREAELALIRRRGYAESHGEVDPGMWAVAAPVVEKRRAIASLWLAVPERRLDPARRAALREAALAAARALSRTLARAAVPRLDSSGARAMNRPKREG
jgi:DNA-binding IclR family transcriptional regulator